MSSHPSGRLVVSHRSENHCKQLGRNIEGHDVHSHLENLLPHIDQMKSEINEYLSVLVEQERKSKKTEPEKQTAASTSNSKPLDACYVDDGVTHAKRHRGGK